MTQHLCQAAPAKAAATSKERLPTGYGLKGHDGSSTQPSTEGEVSMNTIASVAGLVGLDLAKNVFSIRQAVPQECQRQE
jgi:hypothetical protein